MNLARFTVNASPSTARGYDGTNSQALIFALEAVTGAVQRWTLEVYSPLDGNSPLASKGAPLLTLVGATSGQKVNAATPSASITGTLPASGYHTYKVRSTVNGGLDAYGRPSPDLVFERIVVIRTPAGRRKILATESSEYEAAGWAGAQNDDVDAAVDAPAAATVFRPAVSSSVGLAGTNTALIQAAINEAHSNYLAGNGLPTVVELPAREVPLAASSSVSTWWNYGVSLAAATGCLAMRDGVTLRGAGVGRTVLKPSSPSLDVLHVVDGTDQLIEGIEVDGGWTSSGAGHAILQVTSADDPATPVANLVVRHVFCHDVGSYGLGLENGQFTDCLVEDFRSRNTGADGIDIKNRPYPTNDSKGIELRGVYVENPGLRLDGQTGVDIRGLVQGSAVTVIGVGRTGVQMTGVRLRTAGTDAGWCERTTLTGVYVRATNPATANTLGIDVGGADCSVVGGTVDDCKEGVSVGGNVTESADRNTVVGVSVRNAGTRAFVVLPGAKRNKFIGCGAINSAIGFRNEGDYTSRVGFTHENCATVYSTSSGALPTENTAANQSSTGDFAVLGSAAVGRCNLTAVGQSANIDIHLETKGTGVVRFGTRYALGAEVLSGYIEVRDSGGTVRKLAVIS